MKSILLRTFIFSGCFSALAVLVLAVNAQETADRPAVARPAAENILQDDRARAAAAALKDALSNEERREELMRQAQARFGRKTPVGTITDKGKGAAPKPAAASAQNPATKPAAAVATPAATPTAAPGTPPAASNPQALIPDPVANTQRNPVLATPLSSPPPAPVAAPAPTPTPPAVAAPAGTIPAPKPLRPRYNKEQSKGRGESMEITALQSEMDEKNNMATFSGDVIVDSPKFVMKSDHLEIYMNDKENPKKGPDGKNPPFETAIATGALVEIERVVIEDGKRIVEIAQARRAEFDGPSGDTILTGGPPILQRGERLIEPQDANAKIVLRGDGKHQVFGRHKMNIKIEGGGPVGGPATSLESIQNKR